MSKYIIAGPSVAEAMKSKRGSKIVWLCNSRDHTHRLQRSLGSAAAKEGIKVKCKTLPSLHEEVNHTPTVYYTVVCSIE